jgi:hypothetical protein
MLVPEMLYGDTKTVTAACRRHITRFKRGGSWLEAGTMIDVQSAPGLIMVGDPSPLLGGVNVRLYAPFWELEKVMSRQDTVEGSERAFEEALGSAWGVLGLLSQACYHWLLDSVRAERFLEAMMSYWAEFDAVGRRFTYALQRGDALWDVSHVLKFVLARRGVPRPCLVQPLPAGGIAALLPARN